VHGLGLGERLGSLRAPPVELLAARAPVAALPLGHGGDDVTVVTRLLVPAQGELPAHVGLQLEVGDAPFDGSAVQGAAWSAWKAGAVEEDARALDEARH